MNTVLLSLIALIVTLGLLVTFHEFGHYWVARRLGVKVLRFSVGFGKPIWMRRGAGPDATEFAIAAIPLGGYVKMLDEREGPVAAAERHRAFNTRPTSYRIAIVAAGPLANFLFAIVAYGAVFLLGETTLRPLMDTPAPETPAAEAGMMRGDVITAVDGEPVTTLEDAILGIIDRALVDDSVTLTVRTDDGAEATRILPTPGTGWDEGGDVLGLLGLALWQPERIDPVVGNVVADTPAAAAGLQAGDRILVSAGRPIDDWDDWVEVIQAHADRPMSVELERDGQRLSLTMTPIEIEVDGKTIGQIGAAASIPPELNEKRLVLVRHGPLDAMWQGTVRTVEIAGFTLRMLWRMLTGTASLDNLGGPVTIAEYAGLSASYGLVQFLSFLALVSVSLGVLNLLPVPVLDGGHLLYYFIELVRGRPLSEGAQALGQRIGVAALAALMGLAIFNDITRVVTRMLG